MTNDKAAASVNIEEKQTSGTAAPPRKKGPIAKGPSSGKVTEGMIENLAEEVIRAITAIDGGPKVLKVYMEMCARCGTCASAVSGLLWQSRKEI